MKRLFALSLVLVVLLSSAAFGEVQTFKNFTLDIPEGWTAELSDEDGEPGIYTVNIEKNDKSSIMSFTYGKTDSNAVEDLVADWANMETSSSKPERTNDGYYMYTFKNGEGKCYNALGSISGQGHECREHTCENAWRFMSQFKRLPNGSIEGGDFDKIKDCFTK